MTNDMLNHNNLSGTNLYVAGLSYDNHLEAKKNVLHYRARL